MGAPKIRIRNRRKTARWLATGTLAAYAAVGANKPALAQERVQGITGAPQDRALNVIQFRIPPGSLEEVTRAFAAATGLEVEAARPGLLTVASRGVSGPFTVEMALREMLDGTSVTHRMEGTKVILDLMVVTIGVEVTDRVLEVSTFKYTATLRDLPQTISIIPKAVIEQQGATNLRDVLRNVPGLTLTAGEGGAPAGDNLTLRGYSARNDIFVDGVRDLSPQSRDPFNLEQVEVTKGPTSAVYGRGSAGGTINLVSKLPNAMRGISGSVALGNADQRRGTLDINTPLPALGERTGFRLNVLGHESGVPGRNVVRNDRWGFAPSLTFGMGTATRFTLSYYKLKQDNISDYGIPWVPAANTALPEFATRPAPRASRDLLRISRPRPRDPQSGHRHRPHRSRFHGQSEPAQPTALRTRRSQFDRHASAVRGEQLHCDHAGDAGVGSAGSHLG